MKNWTFLARLSRPLLLTIGIASLLVLSLGNTAWTTSAQTPDPGTIPIATPTQGGGGGGGGGGDEDEDNPVIISPQQPSPALPRSTAGVPTPLPQPGEGVITPGVPVSVPSAGGGCTVVVSPDDASESGVIRVTDAPVDTLPARSQRYDYLRACDVTFINQAGVVVPGYRFANPVEVCFTYTDEELARAQNNPASLVIVYFDPDTQQWVELPYVIDPVTRQICGKLSRSGLVALVIRDADVITLPNTSGNMPDAPAVPAAAPAAEAVAAPAAEAAEAVAAPAAAAAPTAAAAAAAPAAPAAPAAAPRPALAGTALPAALTLGETSMGAQPSTVGVLLAAVIAIFAIVAILSGRMMWNKRSE